MSKQKEQKLWGLLGERRAWVDLRSPLNLGFSVIQSPQLASNPDAVPTTAELGASGKAALSDAEPFANASDVTPQEQDFVVVRFRILSAAITRPSREGIVLDLSKPGVLEAAIPLFVGTTLCKNHWQYDVEDWVGAVKNAAWDAQGADVEGVPGINADLMVDRRIAPKIARGLLINPPTIKSVSSKIYFTFEYSHAKLADQGLFWRMQGEEVDGELVRAIVTEITEAPEVSFVNRGADLYNRRLPDLVDESDEGLPAAGDEAEAETGGKRKQAGMASQEQGEKTVKLKQGTIAALGLQGDENTDIPEAAVLAALPNLAAQATLGTQLLDGLREETKAVALRVAALTHKGDGQPTLDARDALLISKADASELTTLKKHYEEQATANLSATCQKCGAKVTSLRSSVESSQEAEQRADEAPDYSVTLM